MEKLLVEIIGDASSLRRELAAATGEAQSFGSKMAALGKTVAVGVGLPLAAAGTASVKMAADFQRSMEVVHTQAGASQKEVDNLSKAVLAMASKVGTGPDDLSKGLYHLESQGLRSAKAMDALKAASEGAKIGGANLEDVTNALGAAIVSNIKGTQNYEQAMGALNAVVGAGDMRMQDLADAMGTGVAVNAQRAGVSLKDVGAALAVFGDNNIRGAKAGTLLSSALRLMEAPSNAAAKALAGVGISSTQLGDDMRHGGLPAAIEDLKAHLEAAGLTATQQAAVLAHAFGGKQSTGIGILVDQLERLKTKEEEVGKGADKFGADWQATTETTAFKFDQMKASLDAVAISIGTVLLPPLTSLLRSFDSWIGKSENQKRITDDVKAAVGDLGSVLHDLKRGIDDVDKATGGFKNTLVTLTTAFAGYKLGVAAASGAQTLMGLSGVAALTAIKGALISTGIGAALVGLGVAAGYVITHWQQTKGWFETFFGWLKTGFRVAIDAVEGSFYGFVADVIKMLKTLADGAAKALGWLPGLGGKLKNAASAVDSWYSEFETKSQSKFADIGKAMAQSQVDSYVSAMTASQARMLAAAGGSGTAAAAVAGSPGRAQGFSRGSGQTSFSQGDMAGLLVRAGASSAAANLLAGIAYKYESGGNSQAVGGVNSNGTRDYGLFQINSAHGYSQAAMLNPLDNARMALSILKSQGFGAWTEAGGRAAAAMYPVGSAAFAKLMGSGASSEAANQNGANPYAASAAAQIAAAAAADSKAKAKAYKIPDALAAKISAAQEAFKNAVTKQHLAVLDGFYRQEESLLKDHGEKAQAQKVANAITSATKTLADHLKQVADKAKAAQAAAFGQAEAKSYSSFAAGVGQLQKLAGVPGQSADTVNQLNAKILSDYQAQLPVEQADLANVQAKLKTATGQAKTKYQQIAAQISSHITAIDSGIEASLTNTLTTLQGVQQQAQQAASAAYNKLAGYVTNAFDAQTQAGIAALGQQYFQGGQTPAEAQLAQMQAADQANQYADAITKAQQQLATDIAAGADQITQAADQAAIDDANRQQTEYQLSLTATKERAKADADYAAAVQKYTDDRTVLENKLNEALASGSGNLDSLNTTMSQYGITLDTVDQQLWNQDYPDAQAAFQNLTIATVNVHAAFDALIRWVNRTTGSTIPTGSSSSSSGGGGAVTVTGTSGAAAGFFTLNPAGAATGSKMVAMASGGIVRKPTVALVGEAGPEAVIPLSHYRGGGDIYVTLPNYLGDKREMVELLRQELYRIQKRNGSSGFN